MSWAPRTGADLGGWQEVHSGRRFARKRRSFNVTTAAGEVDSRGGAGELSFVRLAFVRVSSGESAEDVRLEADERGIRLAERIGGVALEADLVSDRGVRGRWRAELRDGSNYVRQTVDVLRAGEKRHACSASSCATCACRTRRRWGSARDVRLPATACSSALKCPGRQNAVGAAETRIGFALQARRCRPGSRYAFGSVAGVAPAGQLAGRSSATSSASGPGRRSRSCITTAGMTSASRVDEKTMLDVVGAVRRRNW